MSNSQLADDGSWPAGPLKSSLKIRVQPAGTGPARRGAAIGGNRWSREGIPHGHPGSPACSSRKLRPPMNQARNDDGSYDDGWYHDDQQLPPSLGVWPLGRTYVHSSDGALNTGPPTPASAAATSSWRTSPPIPHPTAAGQIPGTTQAAAPGPTWPMPSRATTPASAGPTRATRSRAGTPASAGPSRTSGSSATRSRSPGSGPTRPPSRGRGGRAARPGSAT